MADEPAEDAAADEEEQFEEPADDEEPEEDEHEGEHEAEDGEEDGEACDDADDEEFDEDQMAELAAALKTTKSLSLQLDDAQLERSLRHSMRYNIRGNKPSAAAIAAGANPDGPLDHQALARAILDDHATLTAIWELTDGDDDSLEGFENLIVALIERGMPGSGCLLSQRWVTKRVIAKLLASRREAVGLAKLWTPLGTIVEEALDADATEKQEAAACSSLPPMALCLDSSKCL